MKGKAVLLVVVLAAVSVAPLGDGATLQASDTVHGNALAVGALPSGELVGVTAGVQATVLQDGSGQVFIDTKPLAQTDMQGSARLAARVAAATLGVDWRDHDYLLVFRSGSPVVGGPSAGSIMGLVLTVALHNLLEPDDPWQIDSGFAATGTINPDGTVGPVGGIPEKIQGAKSAGLSLVMYPSGQTLTQNSAGEPVDLRDHCDALDIRCRPATSVVDLVEGSTGIQVDRRTEVIPDTSGYGDQLAPSVEEQLQTLRTMVDALPSDLPEPATELADQARGRLDDAQASLQAERYYTAATQAFQGRIFVRQADLLDQLSVGGQRALEVAEDAVESCESALTDVGPILEAPVPQHANELYAIGAAQVRAVHATTLAEDARARLAAATSFDGLALSVQQSAFCIERAETVTWWAGLADLFGPGPDVEDLEGLARELLERSRDMVSYVDAVSGGAAAAAAILDEARGELDAGRPASAIVRAIEAETRANIVLQTNTGTLSQSILDEAQQNAARAVASARSEGIEPILSVAQVELAQDLDDPGQSLGNLWTARSLALVLVDGRAAPAEFGPQRSVSYGDPILDLGAGVVMGAFAGAVVMTLALGASALRRGRNR